MKSFLKRLVLSLSLLGGFMLAGGLLAQPAYAQYNPLDKACTGEGAGSAACRSKSDNPDSITGSNGVIVRITNIIAMIAGVAAVIVMVVYGFMIVTSYGESGKVTQARNAIIGAAVGLAVIALARTIIVFVVNRL